MISILYLCGCLVFLTISIFLYCRLTVGRCRSRQYMSGKTVLITGASGGIGKATALDLARRNARVLLACRNLKKAEKVKSEIISATGNTNVEVKHLDLESFDSVRKCAEDVLRTEEKLDVLINNAGIVDFSGKVTKDGYEMCMQTNHLGHFLLTLLLLDLLQKSRPSRIINVSSEIYKFSHLNLEDMDGSKSGYLLKNSPNFYCRSKLANVLFTTELAKRLEGTGVTVNCLHPGLVHSQLFVSGDLMSRAGRFIAYCFGKTEEEGAQTSIYLAVDPTLENVTGKYFVDCREKRLHFKGRNKEFARKLFEVSEKIVGVTFQSR